MRTLGILSAAVLAMGMLASNVSAQVGSGWKTYTPNEYLQIETHDVIHGYPLPQTTHAAEAGGSYSRSNGVETFKLFNNDASNRVEVRCRDEYSSGNRQFQGEANVISPTNNESIFQIFGMTGGSSMLMIKAYSASGGTFKKEGGGHTLVTGIYGKWVRLNVIHDATRNTVQIYVNGSQKWSGGGAPGTHYHKYGCYGTLTTTQVQYRNVKFFQK